jgi:hypothetical protein
MHPREWGKRFWLFLGIAGVGSAAALYWVFEPTRHYMRIKPFELPQSWDYGTLLIRRGSPESRDLLFRRLKDSELSRYRDNLLPPAVEAEKEIIKFRVVQHDIVSVEPSEWDNASSLITACWAHTAVGTRQLKMVRYKLEFDGTRVRTAGKSVLQRAVLADENSLTPKGDFLAVLSASGSPRKPIIPFLGGDKIAGTRYHEVFRLSDGVAMGDPVILQGADTANNMIDPCWSPDEDFVIYTDSFWTLWIVPFPPESRKERGKQ